MSNPIEIPSGARFDPFTGKPLADSGIDPLDHADRMQNQAMRDHVNAVADGHAFWEQQRKAATPVSVPEAPMNPYAPTGWQKRNRIEFDLTLPSGQIARVMRIEREDLLRSSMPAFMDTFTPVLMQDTISDAERDRRIRDKMGTDPNAIVNMFMAIDEVVMMATVSPRVTDNPEMADYGGPSDWRNPKFIATALISDISMDDRFAIFAAAFGKSMDELKSLFEQKTSVEGMASQPSVQQDAE